MKSISCPLLYFLKFGKKGLTPYDRIQSLRDIFHKPPEALDISEGTVRNDLNALEAGIPDAGIEATVLTIDRS